MKQIMGTGKPNVKMQRNRFTFGRTIPPNRKLHVLLPASRPPLLLIQFLRCLLKFLLQIWVALSILLGLWERKNNLDKTICTISSTEHVANTTEVHWTRCLANCPPSRHKTGSQTFRAFVHLVIYLCESLTSIFFIYYKNLRIFFNDNYMRDCFI